MAKVDVSEVNAALALVGLKPLYWDEQNEFWILRWKGATETDKVITICKAYGLFNTEPIENPEHPIWQTSSYIIIRIEDRLLR